jgi:hypothetical protein
MKDRSTKAQNGLSNHEVVTLAVYLLGGDTKPVDTEDIAIKTNEIATARFTWGYTGQRSGIESHMPLLVHSPNTSFTPPIFGIF